VPLPVPGFPGYRFTGTKDHSRSLDYLVTGDPGPRQPATGMANWELVTGNRVTGNRQRVRPANEKTRNGLRSAFVILRNGIG
jgi:hypothetical protein